MPTDNACRVCSSNGSSIRNHEATPDPHSIYLLETEADGLYESSSSGPIALHTAAADPHPDYQTKAEAAEDYSTATDVTSATAAAVTAHVNDLAAHPYGTEAALAAVTDQIAAFVAPGSSFYGEYTDDEYSNGSPQLITVGSTFDLENNGAETYIDQLPSGVTEFWDGSSFVGVTENDLLLINVEIVARRTTIDSWLEFAVSDGTIEQGAQILYMNKTVTGTRAQFEGVYRVTADWITNGANPVVRSGVDDIEIYDASFRITRLHAA